MNFKKTLVLFLLVLGSAHSEEAFFEADHFSRGSVPTWVNEVNYPSNPPLKATQNNLQVLLFDTQKNWEEKTTFFHRAFKISSLKGVEQISKLSFECDPSFQNVLIHKMVILRDGKEVNELDKSRFRLLQQEEDLDDNIYNGDISLVFFLEDVRVGDILEYSYSKIGEHPYYSSQISELIYLQFFSAFEKVVYRLLANPIHPLFYKNLNTNIEPKVVDLTPTLREWSWEVVGSLPLQDENDEPEWYFPSSAVLLSQYQSWNEVVKKEVEIFSMDDSPSPEMISLVGDWKTKNSSSEERALLAIRFVQDDIRYFGFEDGMGAHKPRNPSDVFFRRYGDCKDKTMLLHKLLELMEIRSTPVLVHTRKGKLLPEFIPNSFSFNHVILEIEMNGARYYVDPTIKFQGGSLKDNFFPNYFWGLRIDSETNGLTPLPQPAVKRPIEIDSNYELHTDFVRVEIAASFSDDQADRVRRRLQNMGKERFSEEKISEFQKKFGQVFSNEPMQFLDDREHNTLKFTLSCKIPARKRSTKKTFEPLSYVMQELLMSEIDPGRSSPFSLDFPLWMKERITVKNSLGSWKPESWNHQCRNASLCCDVSMQREENIAYFDLEFKYLQDHVLTEGLEDFWEILDEIDDIPLELKCVP